MTELNLPFANRDLWDYLRWHSYFSEQHKLLYVANPKVASTSLQWWFAALEGYSKVLSEVTESDESDPDLIIHDSFRRIAPNVIGLAPDALLRPLTSSAYFRFAVVRNPFTRLFSAWQSKLLLREPLQASPYKEYEFFWRPIETIDDIMGGFEGFLEHLASREAPNFWDIHWMPQATLLRPDLITYTKLAHIEKVRELSSALTRHIGSNVPEPFADRRTNRSLIPYLPDFVTDRAAALIRSLYAQDFLAFGYGGQLPPTRDKFSRSQLHVALQAIGVIRGRHRRLTEIRASLSGQIASLNETLSQRDVDVNGLKQSVSDRDIQISDLNETLLDRDRRIAALYHTLSQRDSQVAMLTETVARRDGQIAALNQAVSKRDNQIASLTQLVAKQEREIADLSQAIERMGSTRLRKWLESLVRRSFAALARLMPLESDRTYRALRFLYRHLPGRLERKLPWAQHLLTDVPKLQGMAFRVAREQMLLPSTATFGEQAELDGLLLAPGRRILMVEHRLPTPDRNSSSVRLYSILKLMTELNWEITFVSNSMQSDYHYVLSDIESELPGYEQAISALGIRYLYGMESLIEHLKSEGGRYRFAFLSYPEIMHQYAPLVRAYMPNAKLVYDTVDLHGVRFAREALAKNNDASLLENAKFYAQMELANAESADVVIAVTDDERREILKHVSTASVEIIANIHSVPSETAGPEDRQGLLFIGHYLHSPNEDAVLYFINDVLPLICEQLTGVPFYVLGSSMTETLRQLESSSVHMLGYVQDPVPWFARARVFVAPLRYGAGMKGKIGQSLSLGLPVVTTSVGAEGMHLEDKKNVLIAESPQDIAAAVVRLYQDPTLWRMLAENGKAHIAQYFSSLSARETLTRLLDVQEESPILPGGS